jgi:thiamine biosynthesis protein ThiI
VKELILVKNGEIALKGLNRSRFEEILIRNIKWRLRDLGKTTVRRAQSAIYIEPAEPDFYDFDEAISRLQKVFGIVMLSRALVVEKSMEAILSHIGGYCEATLASAKTFKVEAKRSDKRFPLTSPQIAAQAGGKLLSRFPHLKVDVHNPEVTVMVEIRDFGAYIHGGQLHGPGGMPVSSSGQAMVLISGGIDSPVAAYQMAKRGLQLSAVHFVSPPYTSGRALEKVETLCEKLTPYTGRIRFFCVPFTKIQEALREHCPEELFTVLMRRMMMRIAARLAEREGAEALITGESLAQVASQTLPALACTDCAAGMLVLRPLIGMDKTEIIRTSREIGTYETSILPYEDCCTVFTPKHPRTKPKLQFVEQAEAMFDFAPLVEQAIADTEVRYISS